MERPFALRSVSLSDKPGTEHEFCSPSELYRVTMQLEPVDDESVLVELVDESV